MDPCHQAGPPGQGMKIKPLEESYLFSLSKIIDFFSLKSEGLKIMPVQTQTQDGQQTRFKAFVSIGDYNGHVGLGVKCSKEVAKLSIVPVGRGYRGTRLASPTLFCVR